MSTALEPFGAISDSLTSRPTPLDKLGLGIGTGDCAPYLDDLSMSINITHSYENDNGDALRIQRLRRTRLRFYLLFFHYSLLQLSISRSTSSTVYFNSNSSTIYSFHSLLLPLTPSSRLPLPSSRLPLTPFSTIHFYFYPYPPLQPPPLQPFPLQPCPLYTSTSLAVPSTTIHFSDSPLLRLPTSLTPHFYIPFSSLTFISRKLPFLVVKHRDNLAARGPIREQWRRSQSAGCASEAASMYIVRDKCE
jgi:hypothetical protein